MEWTTISVALAGVCGVLALPRVHALLVYFTVVLWYPPYLVFGDEVYFSAQRVVGVAMLLKLVVSPDVMRRYRRCSLDSAVAVYMILSVVTLLMSCGARVALRNRGAFLAETLLAYLVVRLAIVDRGNFTALVKGFALLLFPLGVLAAIEVLSGWNPYASLLAYCPWYSIEEYHHLKRFEYYRAIGTSAQPIIFGLIFATLLPLVLLCRLQTGPMQRLWWLFGVTGVLGVISSLSSTPLGAMVVSLGLLVMAGYKRYIRPLAGVVLLGSLAVEIASNRHFYTVFAEAVAFDSANAWYRSRLIDAAIRFLPEYWAYGYGFGDWGWGTWMNRAPRMDACNEYVLQVGRHGVFGFASFIYMLAAAFMCVWRAHRRAADSYGRACTWAVGSSLGGLVAAFFATSLFSTMLPVFYSLLGLCAAGYLKEPSARTGQPRRPQSGA